MNQAVTLGENSLLYKNTTMQTIGNTYIFYAAWQFCPLLIIYGLLLLTCCLVPVHYMVCRCCNKTRRGECIARCLTEHVFSSMLKHTDIEGRKVYTILDYRVPEAYILILFCTTLNLIGVGWLTFAEMFLFEESHACNNNSNLACFPRFPNLFTPRLDCSNLKINNIICYECVYNLPKGARTAHGLVLTTALTIYIIISVLLKVSNGSRWNKRRAVLTVAIQITIVVIIMAAATGLSFHQLKSSYTTEKQIFTLTKNIFIAYTLAYGTIFFPWWSFKKKDNREDYKEL